MSATVLEQILASTRAEVERRKRELPVHTLEAKAEAGTGSGDAPGARHSLREALTAPGIAIVAEFKRRSPSAGALREDPDLAGIVAAYERGGAAALSILTDGPHFEGSLDDLRAARARCALPILRKDFIVDRYQLHEARAAGADAVLLIVAALDQPALRELHEVARELGLEVLVEVHDREELVCALDTGAELIGINNRDLRDFSVDVERTFALLEAVPDGVCVVSESGIAAPGQLRRLAERGVDAVLVGETLMRALDPAAALRELLSGARASLGSRAAKF
ncbi:MAG TPA: indole-3-glycerol phosphate synthase TrpC [Solirubrobacteraceae bacterium]|nr:indole-3-glycerol phosphate synthase TrpC [Solirubrobacteraceae bacterium]